MIGILVIIIVSMYINERRHGKTLRIKRDFGRNCQPTGKYVVWETEGLFLTTILQVGNSYEECLEFIHGENLNDLLEGKDLEAYKNRFPEVQKKSGSL